MDPEKKTNFKNLITKKLNLSNVFIALVILLGIVLLINVILTFDLGKEMKKSSEASKEKLKPARIELTAILNSKCKDCFDILKVADNIKSANFNITQESTIEFDSKEGKELIGKYSIEKVPTIIISGEIDKVNIQGLEKKANALVLSNPQPPYANALTGKIEGRVAAFILKDPKCEKCSNLSFLINQIKNVGVSVYEEKNVEINSDEGKELVKKYGISFSPTIILSKDAGLYAIMQEAWPQVGSKETDGSFVLRLAVPPYLNITDNRLRGIVGVTYLSDKSCPECYDVNLHKQILENRMGFKFDVEEKYDVSDAQGKELIGKYNITLVPTIILSGDVGAYSSSQDLRQIFSMEKDSSYVFRKTSLLGTYKDLTTNEIVKPQAQSEEQ